MRSKFKNRATGTTGSSPVVRAMPWVLALGGAALVVAFWLRHGHESVPAVENPLSQSDEEPIVEE
jgi:hypothetical protein